MTISAGARAHYGRRRAVGDTHNAALRNLANKLLAKLWHCLQTDTPYDETSAWFQCSPKGRVNDCSFMSESPLFSSVVPQVNMPAKSDRCLR